MTNKNIESKLKKLGDSFEPFLYASNPVVVASLKTLGHDDKAIRQIELFDWFQGVGLYGYYELYKLSGKERYLKILLDYYEARTEDGLPGKNINSMAPMLTLISLLSENMVPDEQIANYRSLVKSWAEWLYDEAPRTAGGGFAHLTCEAANAQEMWDDTLFMSVLFLAKAGVVFEMPNYIEEAAMQFMTHQQYLVDKSTGLWFHGYTFDWHHNFAEALWARGNSWITIFVPLFLEICHNSQLPRSVITLLQNSWCKQVEALLKVQSKDGLWPTLLNDPDSYSEASAAAGFIWGIQKGRSMGLLKSSPMIKNQVKKGLSAILQNINNQGILEQVSGGTAMGKEDLDFYREIPRVPKPYGQAMAMCALIETLNYYKEIDND